MYEYAAEIFTRTQLLWVGWFTGLMYGSALYLLGLVGSMAMMPLRLFSKEAERGS